MPAHHQNKHIESIVAEQVEEWTSKFQNHFDEKLHSIRQEQKETLAIVNRLGKYVNILEYKVNSITTNMHSQSLRNENGEIDFPPEVNSHHSPVKNNSNTEDVANRMNMLETFCGYDAEKEAYSALGLGTGDLLLPEHKLTTRLDKLEKSITRLDRTIRHVEHEVEDMSLEKYSGGGHNNNNNNNNNTNNHGHAANGGMTTGLFFPEKARPKSTHGDPRHRPNSGRDGQRGEGGYNGNGYGNGYGNGQGQGQGNGQGYSQGNSNPYTTPHPPVQTGTFGYRSAPSGKSRNVSRPTSAPNVHPAKGQVQKVMEDIRHQIEEVDEKNNMQNTFLMNELMDNVNSLEEKTDRKLGGLDSKLRAYVNAVEDTIKRSVNEVEQSARTKIMHIEANLLLLQRQEKVMEDNYSHKSNANQQQEYSRLLEEKENSYLQQQQLSHKKENDLRAEFQNKEDELRNMLSKNSASQNDYKTLQEETRRLESQNEQIKAEHMKHIEHLQQEFETRRNLVDERTELYKAETQRLKIVHQELQNQVNLEIKQRTSKLESEKHQLEQKLTEEMNTHNLQTQKERVIKDSLQSEIEMFKKSCNQAHQDKDQIVAKLKVAEAKYAELEARLKSSSSPQKHPPPSKPPPPARTPSNVEISPSGEEENDDNDQFAYGTPVARFKAPGDRRQSFNRADTPTPHQLSKSVKVSSPPQSKHAFLPKSHSTEIPKTNFLLSPDTAVKKQGSAKNLSAPPRGNPRQEVAEQEKNSALIGVAALDDGKLQDMVQNKLTQNDIDDIIVLEELIKDREAELEQVTAAKSRAKKKIKNWMNEFHQTNRRPPNQNEKEGVADLYLNHQKLSDTRQELVETVEKMKETMNERVKKVVV